LKHDKACFVRLNKEIVIKIIKMERKNAILLRALMTLVEYCDLTI